MTKPVNQIYGHITVDAKVNIICILSGYIVQTSSGSGMQFGSQYGGHVQVEEDSISLVLYHKST